MKWLQRYRPRHRGPAKPRCEAVEEAGGERCQREPHWDLTHWHESGLTRVEWTELCWCQKAFGGKCACVPADELAEEIR